MLNDYKLPFDRIEGVYFQPWVGNQYAARNPRLLIIGMSHYSWDADEIPSYFVTNYVIHDRISRRASGQFFTNIAATCTGWLPNESERQELWSSVAFYNYIQQFVGNSPRQRHNEELWECSHPAFRAVLRVLKPQLILVIGVTNWNNISNDGCAGEPLAGAPELQYAQTHWYPTRANARALAFHVKHTSAGYNFRKFAPLYASAVRLLKVKESGH